MSISPFLSQLRIDMDHLGIDGYIIPSSDPHQGEYVADHWKSRAWISGFTGSAGTAAVTATAAGVWTDSRYFIQAEDELSKSDFELHKVYNQGSPQYIDWLIEHLNEGDTIACDGRLFSKKLIASLSKKLAKKNIKFLPSHDLIKAIWLDRPPLPSDPIFELGIEHAGESRASKLKRIKSKMAEHKVQHHLISTLDDIAWIFNIRGKDVTYNPVAYAYSVIGLEKSIIYVPEGKIDHVLNENLHIDQVEVRSYEEIWKDLNELSQNDAILIDGSTISDALYKAINCDTKVDKPLPSILMKAIKNEVEIQHFRDVMIKDGIALTKFYMWLEANIENEPTEYDLAQKIAAFRSAGEGYKSESFGAIVGYKANGAIVHYSPDKAGSAKLKPSGLLLVDSGGQYTNGTTDITRTTSLGDITDEERDAYTRVLKGNITLDRAVFPEGTLGVQLDTLARVSLWENKLNYLHGTGHGIGFFLNVHEGPQGFHPGIASRSKNSIDEHMITTNEPGYYKSGAFGIRIENCLLTISAGSSESGKFLKFETLTLFPIDTSPINMAMLTKDEVIWINDYHNLVFNRLSPGLNEEESNWLREKCKAI